MKACDIMTATPLVVRADDPLWKAAEVMRYEDIGAVPVVSAEKEGRLVGLITDRDITVRCVARQHASTCLIRDHMTPAPLHTVRPNAEISEVVEQMEAAQVRRIPVVDEHDRIVGIIAERDLVMKLASKEALPLRKRIKCASNDSVAVFHAAIR